MTLDAFFEYLSPSPVHPLTGKPIKYAIPPGLNPHVFCRECGLWMQEGSCPECAAQKMDQQQQPR